MEHDVDIASNTRIVALEKMLLQKKIVVAMEERLVAIDVFVGAIDIAIDLFGES